MPKGYRFMSVDVSNQENRRYVNVGKYHILSHLGSGGMAAVYRALDPDTGQEVALKVLPADVLAGRPGLLERFRREAQHGTRLDHENIVRLFDWGEANGTFFLVMELVEGTNLQDLITEQGPLDPEEATDLLAQVARALDHAWQKGIVHRDIKPANILLTEKNGRAIAKLADLGLAREQRQEEFRVTREGCTVGTVDYIAPEQARDSSQADVRSDLYSLACTFFHVLAGRPPFAEGTLPERIFKHLEAEPPDLRQLNPAVPGRLAALIKRMLAKKPQDRYQTPAEVLKDLQTVFEPEPPRPRNLVAPPTSTETFAATSSSMSAPPGSDAAVVASLPGRGRNENITTGQIAWAMEQVNRGNLDYGIELLLTCCWLDPGNLRCHQALRQALKARWASGGGMGWLAWFKRLAARFRLKLARKSRSHFRVLALGEEVLARVPNDLAAQLDMAHAATELGLDELARWLLTRAWKHHPENPAILRALGRYYEGHQNYDQAMVCWDKLARSYPADGEAPRKLRDLAALQTLARAKKQTPAE
jgi:serine/threonine protein kinase